MQTGKYPVLYDQSRIQFGRLQSTADILNMFKLIFSRDFKPDLIDWFEACPTGANKWYAAFRDGEPIAMYGLLPLKVQLAGQVVAAALCNNVGVIAEYQGTGLFQTLGEYALNNMDCPLVIGVPNAKAVKGHKRIGWKSYGVLELLSGSQSGSEPESVTLDDFRSFAPKQEPYFKVKKDFDFLKWRYSKPNTVYYQSVFGNEEYVIWKHYENKKQVLELSSYELLSRFSGIVDVWSFKDSTASNALKARGFKPLLANEFILFTDLSIENDPDKIIFELGDNDVF